MTTPVRHRLRTYLLLGGIIPLVAALAFAALVVRMSVLQHNGDGAYAEGRHPDAARDYRGAGRFLPFEDWVAAFDAGAARHAGGDYPAAITDYREALALGVPRREECTVRINMSLADEAIGDAAAKAKKLDEADKAYLAGIAALEDGDCPSDSGRGPDQTKDAATVDERLHQKIQRDAEQKKQQQNQQEKDQQGKKKDKQPNDGKDERQQREQKKREEKLTLQNQQGREKRQQDQEQQEGYGYEPAW